VFLFDTDTLSNLLRPRPHQELMDRFAHTPVSARTTSTINIAELLYGAERLRDEDRRRHLLTDINNLLAQMNVLAFDQASAETFGRIRASVERAGNPRDVPDLMIASVAIRNGLTLVTGNIRHFDVIPGLQIEDWIRGI
jgi:tRNA(fMet)-specific endonuclease VapC